MRAGISDYAAKSMERMRKVFVDLITNCLVSSSDRVIGIAVVVVVVKIVLHCYYYYNCNVFLDLITNCYTSSTADRPAQVNIYDAKVKIHESSQGVMIPNKRLCHQCYGEDKEIIGY